jgi:predicted peptidase
MRWCATTRRAVGTGALLVFGLTTLVWAQEPAPKQAAPILGKTQTRTYDFKDAKKKEMEYALFVPTGYDKAKKTPLIVALHGLGGNPQQMLRNKALTSQADKYGYIVAAPMGYNSGGWYGAQGPGKGMFGKGKFGKKDEDVPENLGELSEKDVMNVLAEVKRDFNVDEKRTYLIGHSMGGAGTYHLGAKYPEIWAGLAPIAAATGRVKNIDKLKSIPVIVIHGDQDTAVKVASARACAAALKEAKIEHEYVEIAGGGHGDVVATGMPKIFEFFEKRGRKGEPAENKTREETGEKRKAPTSE